MSSKINHAVCFCSEARLRNVKRCPVKWPKRDSWNFWFLVLFAQLAVGIGSHWTCFKSFVTKVPQTLKKTQTHRKWNVLWINWQQKNRGGSNVLKWQCHRSTSKTLCFCLSLAATATVSLILFLCSLHFANNEKCFWDLLTMVQRQSGCPIDKILKLQCLTKMLFCQAPCTASNAKQTWKWALPQTLKDLKTKLMLPSSNCMRATALWMNSKLHLKNPMCEQHQSHCLCVHCWDNCLGPLPDRVTAEHSHKRKTECEDNNKDDNNNETVWRIVPQQCSEVQNVMESVGKLQMTGNSLFIEGIFEVQNVSTQNGWEWLHWWACVALFLNANYGAKKRNEVFNFLTGVHCTTWVMRVKRVMGEWIKVHL